MAELINCPHCNTPANPALPLHIPGCRGPLRGAVDTGPPPPTAPAPAATPDGGTAVGAAADRAARGGRCEASGCGATVPPGAAQCPLCETPITPAFALVFPRTARVLEQFPVVLGRDPARSPFADLCDDHANVSRLHAEIITAGDGIAIRDLGSTNGTFVNEAHVGAQPVPLHDGDVVRLGADMRVAVHRA